MARLVLFGAGDIARLAHHYFTKDSPHEVVGFTVDGAYRKSTPARSVFVPPRSLRHERTSDRFDI